MLVPPPADSELTTWRACCVPAAERRRSGKRRRVKEEKATTESRSLGPRCWMTNPIVRFKRASFVPAMLPLTSSTVTRCSEARDVQEDAGEEEEESPAAEGALRWTRTVKSSEAALRGRAGNFGQVVISTELERVRFSFGEFAGGECSGSSLSKRAGSLKWWRRRSEIAEEEERERGRGR